MGSDPQSYLAAQGYGDLTFTQFQRLNAQRCREVFHSPEEWPLEMWALAIAGEAGELANLVKKIYRGDFPLTEKRTDVLNEIADVMTYCDLLCTHLGATTADALMHKFDIVSERNDWPNNERLKPQHQPSTMPSPTVNLMRCEHGVWLDRDCERCGRRG